MEAVMTAESDTKKLSRHLVELHNSVKWEDRIAAILMDRTMGTAGLSEHDAREKARHIVAAIVMERR